MRATAVLLLTGLVAPPAAGIDSLSGVWEGKFTCESTTTATTNKGAKAPATLFLEDLGGGTGRARFNNATVLPVPIGIVSGADVPTSARIAGVMCGFTPDGGGSILQGLAKVKSGSEKGTLSGELITYGPGSVGICRFKVKRTGPLESPVGACPP
jgi:hypothetical protein